ncbi:MAG: SDR family NAD(P)-dependent oxidoreductase [Candidatus Thorarchaeota archaeon]
MNLGLRGKKVLITGASGGIGEASTRLFIDEGARVLAHFHENITNISNLKKEYGDNLLSYQADLTNEFQVLKMFEQIENDVGRIDILICNAGIWPEEYTEIETMTYERWKNTLAIDLDSVFLCCRSFIKQLRKFDGDNASIIIVGSTAAVFGEAGHADYSAAKAAISYGLTKSLKNEIINVTRLGRVNAVCPGWTVSPMTEKYLDDTDGIKHVLKTVPLKKLGQSEDVAHVIVILASDKVSGHVNGEIITIAGGMDGRALHLPEEIDIKKAFRRK